MTHLSEESRKKMLKRRSARRKSRKLTDEARRLKLDATYWMKLSNKEREEIRRAAKVREQAILNDPAYIERRLDMAHLKYIQKHHY
ncbi:hypothetical protein D3H41_24495 [Vibrio neocaledonicus]|nr:hypothetical protein D3H41_24495 [Vibrio neocaledonicus]